ncbi:MAG: HAD family hydrolase [Acidobacteriota bacterium]
MAIGAFFDIDGTLLNNPSLERRFVRHLRYCRLIGVSQWASWMGFVPITWKNGLPLGANKRHLRGVPVAAVESQVSRFLKMDAEHALDPFMIERLYWHQRAGHRTFLISGSIQLLVGALGDHLRVDAACGTRLEVESGRFTGRLQGPHVYGAAKLTLLDQLARLHQVDLSNSFAYANDISDRSFLGGVGHPFAVQPDEQLLRLAEQSGWPVLLNAGVRLQGSGVRGQGSTNCGLRIADSKRRTLNPDL